MLTRALFSLLIAGAARAEHFDLKASPGTVVWGYYWAGAKPALRIHSGDTVRMETVSTGSPARFEEAGVRAGDIDPNLRQIYANVKDRGPGGHVLTGPVWVDEAEPGDVLEVRIQKIEIASSFAYNGFRAGAGALPEDFPYARMKIIPLDLQRMIARFGPGIEIPLRPFFGSMGVAPAASDGRISSAPPGTHAGNLDNKDLVAGTTLYIPVHTKGALFEAGDGHAGQGDGEVTITALETALTGEFQFIVRKNMRLLWPRGETPTHYICMGIHEDLREATKLAIRETVDFLVREKRQSREDAYMLASTAVNFVITQLVDGNKGVHAMIPKSIFVK